MTGFTPAPRQLLAKIAETARAGRLDEAAVMGAAAYAARDNDPVLSALLGAVELNRGQFARAAFYLEHAHNLLPSDVTIRANLVECLYRSGQPQKALALCDEAVARADTSLRIARIGGAIAQETEQYPLAIALYRLVLRAQPEDWSIWNNLGNTLVTVGDYPAAVEALEKALAAAPESQPIRINFANALLEIGEVNRAEIILRDAANEVPNDPEPLVALHSLYRRAGYDDAAYEALRDAAGRAPDNAVIQNSFAHEAVRATQYDVAETAYKAALALDAGFADAFVGLASVYERVNREEELDGLRDQAVAAGVAGPPIDFIDALRFRRANRHEEAFEALERAGDVVVDARREHLRGVMLDRLGRYDEAFDAFRLMNLHLQDDFSKPRERAVQYRDGVQRSIDLVSREWTRSWTSFETPSSYRTPIFLVGFPRSGTTLLDTMLMSVPLVTVLEEEPFIGMIEQELGGIEALASVDAPTLARARERYFEMIDGIAPLGPDSVVVDKHPMHLNKVPVIRRLFPDARFVLAMRHPCDVLLSCYLTNFRTNNAMANFLDLGDAAKLYDMTFTHWEKVREAFDLPVRTVVYERLVEDTARELRPLFDWLGLAWPEEGLDHREAARARGMVSTASYAQVVEPVYQRSAGRWKRYERHLAPIFDTIRPWVDRFGYSLDDGRVPEWPASAETASA